MWDPLAQQAELREFEIRIDLDDPPNIIRSATCIDTQLLMQGDNLGTVSLGTYANLLVVEGDSLSDVIVMTNPQKNLKLIMKGGLIYKNDSDFCCGYRQSSSDPQKTQATDRRFHDSRIC